MYPQDIMKEFYKQIPETTDILITHGPPLGILDKVDNPFIPENSDEPRHAGCEALSEAIERIKPFYHMFGHIHEGYGTLNKGGVSYINAASVNVLYKPVNKPVQFTLPRDKSQFERPADTISDEKEELKNLIKSDKELAKQVVKQAEYIAFEKLKVFSDDHIFWEDPDEFQKQLKDDLNNVEQWKKTFDGFDTLRTFNKFYP